MKKETMMANGDGQDRILVKGKWINGSGDVTIVQMGPRDAGAQLVVFYDTDRYPGWHVNDETTLDGIKNGYLNGAIQRSIVVEHEDDVLGVISCDCSVSKD